MQPRFRAPWRPSPRLQRVAPRDDGARLHGSVGNSTHSCGLKIVEQIGSLRNSVVELRSAALSNRSGCASRPRRFCAKCVSSSKLTGYLQTRCMVVASPSLQRGDVDGDVFLLLLFLELAGAL